jgi:hypothetical protein
MTRAIIQVTAPAKTITVASAAISVSVDGSAITSPIGTIATTMSPAKIARSGNSGVGLGSDAGP